MFSVAKEIGESKIQEGVVSCQVGPAYETVAEMKLFQAAGVDALGMSTVYEVMAARQVGIKEKAPLTRSSHSATNAWIPPCHWWRAFDFEERL